MNFVSPRSGESGPRVGQLVLGWFRLDRVIGSGAYAVAFRATDVRHARPAVVKIARPHLLEGQHADQVRRRFADELRAINSIRHPNLVSVFGAGQTGDGLPAIAMEFVEGRTLADHLRGADGPMAPEMVAICFTQLASALQAIHAAGVVHRDVSPDNVMWGSDATGKPKVTLLDFGIAKLDGQSRGTVGAIGTPGFIAPEQFLGNAVPASDMYALGAILWWALAGTPHHRAVGDGVVPPLDRRPQDVGIANPGVPPSMRALVARLLDPDPGRRPSAAEFLRLWQEVSGGYRQAAPSTAAIAPPPQWGEGGGAPALRTREDSGRHAQAVRVLLVDPNPISQKLVQGYLRKLPCAVEVTSDPRRATRSDHGQYDVVLLSSDLHGVDVGDVVAYLHEHYPERATVVTGYRRVTSEFDPHSVRMFVELPGQLAQLEQLFHEIAGARSQQASDPSPWSTPARSLDASALQALIVESPELALQTVDAFIGELPESMAQLEDCSERGDADGVRRMCHSIETSSRILGADHLARLARALRELVVAEGLEVVPGFHAEMEREYGQVFRELMTVRRGLAGAPGGTG